MNFFFQPLNSKWILFLECVLACYFFLPPTFCMIFFCVDGVEKLGIPSSIYNYKRSGKESLNKNIKFYLFCNCCDDC